MTVRRENDAYYTPPRAILALAESLTILPGMRILEPAAGDGRIVGELMQRGAEVDALDIDKGQDFLAVTTLPHYDAVITNPPYKHAQVFVEKSLQHADAVVMLLRLGFMGSKTRLPFWQENPPTAIYVLVPRPSFTNGGTDSSEYAWFCWDSSRVVVPKDTPAFNWLDWKNIRLVDGSRPPFPSIDQWPQLQFGE